MDEFRDIIGNDQIKDLFLRSIHTKKIPHAFILSGEDGMGKKMFARSFAKLLLCENPTDDRPCGKCRSCRQFEGGSHPDVIYLSHQKASVIGVDDIRDGINRDIVIRPYSSEYKIYIVDEAEKMSVQAQNALLKTLESPPSYAIIFLLTTNGANFLPTILSRAVVLNLKQVPEEEMRSYLAGKGVAEEKITPILKLAGGNIGKALKMAESEDFSAMMHDIMSLMENIHTMTTEDLIEATAKLSEYRFSIKDCLEFIRMWYRDVLLFKATNDLNVLIFRNNYRAIQEAANRSSFDGVENVMQAIDTALRRLDANVNFELTMELLLLAIKDSMQG